MSRVRPRIQKVELRVAPCRHSAAKYAVMHWHYSRRMPIGKLVKYGVWEDRRFVGAVVFARGACKFLGSRFGLTHTEVCELVRVALCEHRSQVSRILAIACKLLKRDNPGIRMIVSFADSDQGHYGGIYQANGWLYTGDAKTTFLRVNGETIHVQTAGLRYPSCSLRWLRDNVDPKAEHVSSPPKYRYVKPLDKEMLEIARAKAKPYPRRKQAIGGDHPQSEGAAPIPTL